MRIPESYELVEKRGVEEIKSEGYLLRHKKTGARIFVLENNDENKVFYVGFRTPPLDSTGCAHITEHSVLCGSRLFPAKDPFVELAKGSMNTFLNAMTYPDKTVYPVASCNDKDFENLMHVYMDAVYHPNIYTRPQIFKQEGWHYELDDMDGELTINGVVYNEMKGAFSSPEDTIDRKMFELLYPDTAYALESGGDPDHIPELTYEDFLAFHGRYYHPSNSFVYLYGNCDMAERLEWLDREYLSDYEYLEVDSKLAMQKPFEAPVERTITYGITDDEEEKENTYFQYNWVIDTALNRELYLAFQILDYAILSSSGAPVREKLMKAGICSDVMSCYENGILQPYYSVMIRNSDPEHRDKFISILFDTLKEVAEKGIDEKSLDAAINNFEFKYREADFGAYPKGLMYGLQCLDSWLYVEKDPFMHISATATIDFLKEKRKSGYFEELIRKYLLENPHRAYITALPEKSLTTKKEKELADKLAAYKAGLSDEEKRALVEDTAALKAYQSEPSAPEELAAIPMLSISDIRREAAPVINEEIEKDGVRYLYHDVDTNGISYLTLIFDMRSISKELTPYMSLLRAIMGTISTEHYSYFELANEINANTGGITPAAGLHQWDGGYMPTFEIDAKMLKDKTDFAMDMIEEMMFSSKLDEHVRIKELLLMARSRMQMLMLSSGHHLASKKAVSYFSDVAAYDDLTTGYGHYKFVNELLEDYDAGKDELTEKMREVARIAFRKENLLVSFGGSRDALEVLMKRMGSFVAKLSGEHMENVRLEFEHNTRSEGYKSSSQVQYVAMAGDFKAAGLDYTGSLRVLNTIMAYDYLWINVRVLGGAYGCMSAFRRNGSSYMVSYRDPGLSQTLDIYKKAADYLEGFDGSDRDITKYIIGTMASLDIPRTPRMECDRGLRLYLSKLSYDDIQKERDEILSTDREKVRGLAPYLKAVADQAYVCVVGGEERINRESSLFEVTKPLF